MNVMVALNQGGCVYVCVRVCAIDCMSECPKKVATLITMNRLDREESISCFESVEPGSIVGRVATEMITGTTKRSTDLLT